MIRLYLHLFKCRTMRSIARLPRLTILAVLLAGSGVSEGAVISRDWKTPGDGLLTYDEVNSREWLELTETQLFKFPGDTLEEKYQAVINETSLGGMFAGFRPVISEDLVALAVSAGVDPDSFDGSDTGNGMPARALAELLGSTYSHSGSLESPNSTGFLDEFDGTDRLLGTVFVAIDGRTGYLRGGVTFFRSRQGQDSSGVWLYRQVPEPTTATLCVILVGCLLLIVRRA